MPKNKIGSSKDTQKKRAECAIEMSASKPSKCGQTVPNKSRSGSSSSSSSSDSATSITIQNTKCSCSNTCLHSAAKNCNYEQIKSLLEHGEDPCSVDENNRTALHCLSLMECSCLSCIDLAEVCMKFLLAQLTQESIDIQDSNGDTSLSLAVEFQNVKCAQLLLLHGADYTIRNSAGNTALNTMVTKTPDVMVELMNNAITVEKFPPNNVNCVLKLNFGPVVGDSLNSKANGTTNGQRKELNILTSVLNASKNAQNLILCHPLISTFLDLKWKRVRKYFVTFFACYIFWLLSYTSYIVKVYLVSCPCEYFSSANKKEKMIEPLLRPKSSNIAESGVQNNINKCHLETGVTFDAMVLLVLTLIMAVNEVLKIILVPNIYFRSKLNYCSWILIAMVIITAGPVIMEENSKPDPWQYQAAAFAIFLSWVMILVQIETFPSLGRYVEMLGHVLKNFGQSMLTFASLFIAFALSFNVLFPGEDGAFSHFFYAILKVLVMMAGEVDYQDTFYDKDADSTTGPLIGHILYAAFVIIISIVLMNLLIGLTVSDIQTLQSQAEIRRISRQIGEIALLETWAFSNKLPKFIRNILSYDISVLKMPAATGGKTSAKDRRDRSISEPLLHNSTYRCRPNEKKDKSIPENVKFDLLQIALKNYHRASKSVHLAAAAAPGNTASLSSN